MDARIFVGDLVKSKNGRDKGEIFLVVNVACGFCFIANGKERKVNNLKKKNLKHVEKICDRQLLDVALRIQGGSPVGNDRLKGLIKALTK